MECLAKARSPLNIFMITAMVFSKGRSGSLKPMVMHFVSMSRGASNKSMCAGCNCLRSASIKSRILPVDFLMAEKTAAPLPKFALCLTAINLLFSID